MTLKETYNLIAEDWHREHEWDDWSFKATDTLVSLLKPGAHVLDAGCGGGRTSKYLVGKGLVVTGIDLSEKMVEIAEREVPGAAFSVRDVREIGLVEGVFDAILLQAVLLHLPKRETAEVLRASAEKVPAGGYICISVKRLKADGPEEEIKQGGEYGYPYERFFSYYSLEECRAFFTEMGWAVVFEHVFPVGRTAWIQIIAKKP